MQLYSGSSEKFYLDTTMNQIADKLFVAFTHHFRREPSRGEKNSWHNSLSRMAAVMQFAQLNDNGVILEMQIPQSSLRLDFMITGHNQNGQEGAVIVELKQWEKAFETEGEVRVRTFVGGGNRDLLHPSIQVRQYRQLLSDFHSAFYEDPNPISLSSCSYLHNYAHDPEDAIFASKFNEALESDPLFTKDDVEGLSVFLKERVGDGRGLDVLSRIEEGRSRPSKQLMEHVGKAIDGVPEYVLVDDQLVAFDTILSTVRLGNHLKQKHVVIIKGGPGTGKSVIAINLLGRLLKEGYSSQYATGSRAFTQTLRKVIGKRGEPLFKYFNSYVEAEPEEYDVIIADEAHRLRDVSATRFQKSKSGLKQIEEVLKAARVAVFLLDDFQVVRPDEVGSVEYIKEYAAKHGCKLEEFQLKVQFRCAGSDGFISWINNTLGIDRTANIMWTGDEGFDFKIFDSPESLERAIREKAEAGHKARMTAGFCWPWSKQPDEEGNLVEDVVIGEYHRAWNAHPEAKGLKKGIPVSNLWAYDAGGIEQVGCVYTAQGFEFDYVGVIVGNDIVYDFDKQEWVGLRENSQDRSVKSKTNDRYVDLVRNAYRILLSRGMKGCYVHFVDKDTERFVKTRIEAGKYAGINAESKEEIL